MDRPDIELLREYASSRADEVFAILVRRHVDLVFSAARRQAGSEDLAAEITQTVFLELARAAGQLRDDSVVPAWLYEVARRKSIDVIRRESRRRAREAAAAEELLPMKEEECRWSEIEPLLDNAMGELEGKDRAALILRFFENRSLREVGVALGASEDTAQKRVSRALERLRKILLSRGAAVSSAALASGISGNAVQAAPIGLIGSIGTAVAGGKSLSLSTTLLMTTTQKFAAIALITLSAGTAIYESTRATKLAHEAEQARTAADGRLAPIRALEEERNSLSKRVAALEQENEQLRRNSAELMKLRAEVTRLSEQNRERKPAEGFAQVAIQWKEKEVKLRRMVDARPEQRVPEMDLLDDRVWLDIARDADLESDEGVRRAFSELRRFAKNLLAPELSEALAKYLAEHDGNLPARLSELKPLFKKPLTDAMLDQYELLYTGKFTDVPKGQYVVSEKSVVDPDYDRLWKIDANGYRNDDPRKTPITAAVQEVLDAYRAEHGYQMPNTRTDLLPYIKTPAQKEAFRKILDDGPKEKSAVK